MRRYALELSDTFLPAAFLEMFGDPIKNQHGWPRLLVEEVSNRITKGESPAWQGFAYCPQTEGVRFITSENVGWGRLSLRNGKFVPQRFHVKLKRSQLKPSDLLVNLVGASIGRACLATKESLPANVNQAVGVVTLDSEKAVPYFVLAQLLDASFQRYILGQRVESARANISLTDLAELPIVLPPLPLQYKFAGVVERYERLCAVQQESLRQAEHLFQSLLHEAFTT